MRLTLTPTAYMGRLSWHPAFRKSAADSNYSLSDPCLFLPHDPWSRHSLRQPIWQVSEVGGERRSCDEVSPRLWDSSFLETSGSARFEQVGESEKVSLRNGNAPSVLPCPFAPCNMIAFLHEASLQRSLQPGFSWKNHIRGNWRQESNLLVRILVLLGMTSAIGAHFSSTFQFLRPDIVHQHLASSVPPSIFNSNSSLCRSGHPHRHHVLWVLPWSPGWGCAFDLHCKPQSPFQTVRVWETLQGVILDKILVRDFILDSHHKGQGFQCPNK